MSDYLRLFTYIPYAVFAAALLLFVLRLGCAWWGKLLWSLWLAFCCSVFLAFRHLGHANMSPEFPELLIWFWNWSYCGAMMLAMLSLVLFFRFPHKGMVLPLVAWGLAAWGCWNCVRTPEVCEREFAFADLPAELKGYRIVQISDLHASSALGAWRTRAIVERANELQADLICLTGDYGDGNPAKYHEVVEPLRDLRARDGVWAVSGNHEWFSFHLNWWPWYERLGLKFLSNGCVFPRKCLALGGVDDPEVGRCVRFASRQPDVGKAFAAATNGEFRILMEHQPIHARENASRHGVSLQLSGHTHGGIMPGIATLVKGLNAGYVRGPYAIGDAVLYVSPGCGQSSGFLMRFFDPSEITLITLQGPTH